MTNAENQFEIVDIYELKLKEYEKTLAENEPWDEGKMGCTRAEYKRKLFGNLGPGEEVIATQYFGCAEDVILPEGVTGMSEYLFARNKTLKKVRLPDSLRSVNTGAFLECTALEEVAFGASVCSIGGHAFQGCTSLKRIELSDSVHTLREYAFEGCAMLEEAKLGTGLKVIKWDAFANCKSLKEIVLPESLEEVSLRVFRNCDLGSIYIPKNVDMLGNATFSGNPNLKTIEVDPENPHQYSKGNCLFSTKNKWLISAACDFVMPDDGSFTRIGDSAFIGREDIIDLRIPEGVSVIDSCAFKGCKNLRSVIFPSSLEYICPLAFEDCTSLEEIIIPGGVKQIERFAFGSSGLRKAVLKRGVAELDNNAFFKCESLEEVYLSNTVTIGKFADPFFRCGNTLKIYIEKSTEEKHEQLLNILKRFQVEFIDRSEIFDSH